MSSVRFSFRDLTRVVRRFGRRLFGDVDSARVPPDRSEPAEREQLMRRILSTIHNNSILLCGDPGCGKSSILIDLKKRLAACGDPTTEFHPVHIDLHDVPEWQLFATVADAVLGQLAPGTPSRVVPFDSNYSHRDLANDFRRVIRRLRERSTKRAVLVLLVDGIDELNSYDPRTTQKVRSLFMASLAENLVMVASAVEIDKRWEQEGSPWYNFFEEIEVNPVDRG